LLELENHEIKITGTEGKTFSEFKAVIVTRLKEDK
jgi:hypothetical protein